MKPVKLTMCAFGPYADKQVLDFRQLGDHTLFLICGPTGAGKSTILDAMCYALYGKTSGSVRSGESMRSAYASLDQETRVEFDFALGGKYYRVERAPFQQARRKRGDSDKPVDKPAHAALYEIDKDGQVLRQMASKGVEDAVERLLGVGADQFRQIILLPQGEFRKLLLADSTDRQAIMQELFQTGRFEQIEKRLQKKAGDLAKEVTAARDQIQTLLASVEAESEDDLKDRLVQMKAKAEEKKKDKEKAGKQQAEVQKAYNAAQQTARLFEDLEKAEKEKKDLEGQKENIEKEKQKLEKAKAAERLTPKRNVLGQAYTSLKNKEKEGTDQRNTLNAREKELEKAEQNWKQIEEEDKTEKERTDKIARLEALTGPASQFETVASETAKAEAAEKKAKADLTAAQTAYDDAEKKHRAARLNFDALTEKFLKEQASGLAAGLKDGEPCPVCGSTEHPHPAAQSEDTVTKEDVDRSRKERDEQAKIEQEKKTALDTVRQTAAKAESAASAGRAQLKQLAAQVPEAYQKPGVLEKELTQLRKESADFSQKRTKAEKDRQDLQVAVNTLEGTLKRMEEDWKQLHADYEEKLAQFREDVKQAGFKDMEEQKESRQLIPAIPVMEKAIQAYEAACLSNQKTRDSLQKEVAGKTKPDMTAWDKKNQEANQQVETVTAELARLQRDVETAEKTQKDIARIQKKIGEHDEKVKVVGGLYDVISGKETGVNLERFVLGALLDDVTRQANIRLSAMSGRRYQLQRHTGERADKRRNGGLDLEVMDSYSGKARSAATLSGGETFLASLSLALGLADVVQEYAGGVHLDSMFIDEGFGSLDQETLDLALRVLTHLQGNGRLVGIISHVDELEERITTRLRIEKTKRGSRAVFEVE
jgi:exonuclease SbcC